MLNNINTHIVVIYVKRILHILLYNDILNGCDMRCDLFNVFT